MLVASGSEDGKVLVWHARQGEAPVAALRCVGLINVLLCLCVSHSRLSSNQHTHTHNQPNSGHGGIVSSVAFCPAHPHLLASASDDHSVRLWVAPESAVGGSGDAAVVVRAGGGE